MIGRSPRAGQDREQMNRAVFIDRDGTISEEVGYINHPSRFRVFAYAAEAIKLLHQSQWLAILITNQAGVARGYFSEEMVRTVHADLVRALADDDASLDAIYYCPHHPSVGQPPYRLDCDCRKPKPGLLLRAASDHGINLAESWMVGDRYSDVELAHNAGVHSALVLSGYGRGEWEYQKNSWELQPELIAENLLDAVRQIVNRARDESN
jgi:D-glycero-D-manno-heptose 1,7-bisphosphate phosphatase